METQRSGSAYEDITLDLTPTNTVIRPPIAPKPKVTIEGKHTRCISEDCIKKELRDLPGQTKSNAQTLQDPQTSVFRQQRENTRSLDILQQDTNIREAETDATEPLNKNIGRVRRQGGLKFKSTPGSVRGTDRSGNMSRDTPRTGLQQLVEAPRDSQRGYSGASRMNGLAPRGYTQRRRGSYVNASRTHLMSENCDSLQSDPDDTIEDNPAYKSFPGRTACQYEYATAEAVGMPVKRQMSQMSRSSTGSSESELQGAMLPEYLDLLDDTEGNNTQGEALSDAEDCDIYEYCWNSDEFSEDEDLYGNATEEQLDAEISLRLQNKRRRVMEEIVSTETTYVDRLFILLRTSFHIEGANAVKQMYPANQHNQMFPSMENLFRLHAENILPTLRSRLDAWTNNPRVADIWQKYQPFLAIYKQYSSMFAEAVALIQKCKKSSEEFATFLKNTEKKGEFRKLTLENYMLEPVQRISRYKLLLHAYSRSLRPDDDEQQPLQEVIEGMDRQIKECQVLLGAKEVLGDFQKVQDRLEDMLSVLNPRAKLLKEGGAMEVTANLHRNQHQRYLFLFSDFLLVCTKKLSGKYSICLQLDASELRVRQADSLVEQGYSPDVTMLLKGRERAISLQFLDSVTKDDWEEMFLYAITARLGQRLEKSTNCAIEPSGNCAQFDRAPEWIVDDSATSCMICDLKFKMIVRPRHHCRGCGIVVCSKCSSQKMALPYMNNEIKRVCDSCFLRGRQKNPELTRNISHIRRHIKPGTERDRQNLHRSQAYGAQESET